MLKFSLNLLDDLKPRAITRDLDWGVPVPLDGWRDRTDKRIYVWFDAVIGYLSASIEWARRSGDPDAWRAWWQDPDAESYYFMGKDNIVFHSEIWPAMLFGYYGQGDKGGTPGSLGALNLPTEVVSSEFLTMEGRKFSSSRSVVIYVGDFLARYDADALRYYVAVAGPENQDTDFTWSEFLRRNNDELVATWGNLVNRTVSLTAKNIGSIPAPGELTDADHELLERSRQAFGTVGGAAGPVAAEGGDQRGHARRRRRPTSTCPTRSPWKLKTSPTRTGWRSVLHVALQVVDDAQDAAHPVPAVVLVARCTGCWAARATWAGMPRIWSRWTSRRRRARRYPVLTGDYDTGARWESTPIRPGTPMAAPTPIFTKLDPSIVDEELARLEQP